MIGTGSMGGMLSLLFAEYGIHTHFYDPSKRNVEELQSQANNTGHTDKITHHNSHESLCEALRGTNASKVFMFSIPHGGAADDSIEALDPYLEKGDIIMDASNEHWQATECRQKRLEPKGVHYVGMGVSGGYQSARHGPSISPGGSEAALAMVMPLLHMIAAKDRKGRPCVAKLGLGGCGHYVKMVHNGIEHGMMTALCEAWAIMDTGLGMSYEEIGSIFQKWNEDGPLRDNYLVRIGAQICTTRKRRNGSSFVLSDIRDKVVQDADDSEGTGTWCVEEGINLHVPHPTITAAHIFRVASADAAKREDVKKVIGGGSLPTKISGMIDDRSFIDHDMHQAVYASFLMSFIQGLHILSAANEQHKWHLDFGNLFRVWRQGCIIQSDYIVDLLEAVYRSGKQDNNNLLSDGTIAYELQQAYPALKTVVVQALEADLHVPVLSASLEFYKYSSSANLPTTFEEAQLDYFGAHMFDLKADEPGQPVTGSHHFEWEPAKGIKEGH
ncbi:6-phosphogluconate dehydrogenase, decarboxylating [Madurella mycetomatis]|uniref:6-phosphogluconate dehydrogenase, decarboxylating n=1 Tax=Madurella mycetomatis TaxID=100816 RepID=A0A175W901_9PEZI|nr:6-phosphogluconate dehydrogenase, decarboxylating [Madurella mycetomatis]KXX82911.1 6-phosphogluconate dehydrogenase, decarboxylating [Madurella mycetomatis]